MDVVAEEEGITSPFTGSLLSLNIHQGEQTLELTIKRRNEWLSNINRGKVPDSTANNFRVCSDHFHSGNDNKII